MGLISRVSSRTYREFQLQQHIIMIKLDSEGDAKESFLTKYLRVTGVVALYWSVSITLVFTNKYLLNSDELKLDAPFFVTWSQCVVTCVMTYISAKFGLFGVSRDMNFDATTTRLKCKQVLPLSIAFVSMITFNNLTLGKVGVAFYTIARSQSIVFSRLTLSDRHHFWRHRFRLRSAQLHLHKESNALR